MTYGLIAIALAGFAFAVTAIALMARIVTLNKKLSSVGFRLNTSEKERDETRTEFASYQVRIKAQMEGLHNELTDMEDLLANCSDPELLRHRFDLLLQRAAGGSSDSGSDELPGDALAGSGNDDSA